MTRFRVLPCVLVAMFAFTGTAPAAEGHGHHAAHNGGGHGIGVLNAVDAENSKVNITHGPIPALKWPEMTMDVPVVEGVDLADFDDGDKVQFTVEQNGQKMYEITMMCETDKDEITEGRCNEHHAHGDSAHHQD